MIVVLSASDSSDAANNSQEILLQPHRRQQKSKDDVRSLSEGQRWPKDKTRRLTDGSGAAPSFVCSAASRVGCCRLSEIEGWFGVFCEERDRQLLFTASASDVPHTSSRISPYLTIISNTPVMRHIYKYPKISAFCRRWLKDTWRPPNNNSTGVAQRQS